MQVGFKMHWRHPQSITQRHFYKRTISMGCAPLICSTTTPLPPPPLRWTVAITAHQRPWNGHCRFSTFRTFCSSANSDTSLATVLHLKHTRIYLYIDDTDIDGIMVQQRCWCRRCSVSNFLLLAYILERDAPMTGGAFDFKGATISLTNGPLSSSKKVTLIRHGLSSWNEESRIQGSSDLSTLTDTGAMQAEKCRQAIANLSFDQCFSSPISRAKSSAEIIWQGREQPLVFLDTLKEGHLFFLEGMKNEDARKKYPELYTAWREDPVNFQVDGIYPVQEIWKTAREAWREILSTPGEDFLVVTHKSILRALICTALGLGPVRFRAIDVNNCGISVFLFNKRGEAMLQCLNMTAHMHSDHFYNY